VPQPPASLAGPPAGRRDPAAQRRQVADAQPRHQLDRGLLVGQWDNDAAFLDADPGGGRQAGSGHAADVGDQVRAAGDVAEPGLAVAQGQRTGAGVD
jgi:hypothetical protein